MHKLLSIDLSSESRFSSINIPLVDESLVNSYIVTGGEWSKLQLNPYFKFWKVVEFHSFQRIWTPVQRRIPFESSFKFIEEVEPSRLGICVQTIRRFLVSTSTIAVVTGASPVSGISLIASTLRNFPEQTSFSLTETACARRSFFIRLFVTNAVAKERKCLIFREATLSNRTDVCKMFAYKQVNICCFCYVSRSENEE